MMLAALLPAADLKVAVLHPLLADLAKQVGGSRVEVVDLLGPAGDPHHFDPTPDNLAKANGASLYLVAGMGLEGYLPKLQAVAGKEKVVEVGKTLPALENHEDHADHGDHVHTLDPHWWHSVDLFRRASGVVVETFIRVDPAGAEEYRKNGDAFRLKMDGLERWVKREVVKVPRERRHLATAHAAFNYFCKDFGFTPHPVQGLNREQAPDPRQLAALITELKKNQVGAIFPEKESNPKILQTLTKDTGILLGEPLVADGAGAESYEAMMRWNVAAIVKALGR